MIAKTKTKTKRKTIRRILIKNKYTRKQKERIADQINDLKETDVLDDFKKLQEIGCAYHKELSLIGNKVVNKYTLVERLNATGKQKVNFYDIWRNKNSLKNVPSIKKMVQFYKTNRATLLLHPVLRMAPQMDNERLLHPFHKNQ